MTITIVYRLILSCNVCGKIMSQQVESETIPDPDTLRAKAAKYGWAHIVDKDVCYHCLDTVKSYKEIMEGNHA